MEKERDVEDLRIEEELKTKSDEILRIFLLRLFLLSQGPGPGGTSAAERTTRQRQQVQVVQVS